MRIPLFKIYSEQDDIDAVTKVIDRGTFWAIGPEIEEFEKSFALHMGVKYALSFNSGTSALHALMLAHDIKGREVIVPSFTFIATANAVLMAGGIPVFAEVEEETYGLRCSDVERRITDRTAAIMPIHYGGFPARDIELIRDLARKKGVSLIEDNAQSYGASINGKLIGTFGDSSIVSFCQNKIITTGEGGMILTDSESIYEKAKLYRSHGRLELAQSFFSSIKDNDYVELGYNFRMSSMTAALGLSQLKKIDKIIEMRREKARYIKEKLSGTEMLSFPPEFHGHLRTYQMFPIRFSTKEARDQCQEYLAKAGIMSKVYFEPVHLKTLYTSLFGYKERDYPVTEKISSQILIIPIYPHISKEEMDYMTSTILRFFEEM